MPWRMSGETGRGVCRREAGEGGLRHGGWPWRPTESVPVFEAVTDVIGDKAKVACQGIRCRRLLRGKWRRRKLEAASPVCVRTQV